MAAALADPSRRAVPLPTVDQLAALWPAPLDDTNPDPAAALTAVPDGDPRPADLRFVAVNAAAAAAHGMTPDQMNGRTLLDIHPGMAGSGLLAAALRTATTGIPASFDDLPFYNPADGVLRRYAVRVAARPTAPGMIAVVWREITDLDEQQNALTRTTTLLTAMLANRHGLVVLTDGRDLLWTSPGGVALLGYRDAPDDMLSVVHPDDLGQARTALDDALAGIESRLDVRLRHHDGRWIDVDADISPFRTADGLTAVLVSMRDVTDAVATHAQLHAQRTRNRKLSRTVSAFTAQDLGALLDPLTGLPGRAATLQMLDDALSRRTSRQVGVLTVDIDRFATINQSFPPSAADAALREVAHRLASQLRPGDRLARTGGDAFTILRSASADTDLAQLAAQLAAAVRTGLDIDGHRLVLTISSGAAMSEPGESAEELLLRAESVLGRAKVEGPDTHLLYDAAMAHDARERVRVEDGLRTALAAGAIVAHYQPIVSLPGYVVVGYEALVRWQHPDRGLLGPAAFLPVAEASDLICDIDAAMVARVAADLAARPHLPPISVNISARDLAHPDRVAALLDELAAHRIPGDRVSVEVTETAALSLTGPALSSIELLRAAGVGIHVDDFGTGFSSLSLLVDLPVTGVKLDRRFTSALTGGDRAAHALAEGLATLTSGLGLVGIAEGVETVEQADALTAMGWPCAQGYLFGRPGPLPR